MICRPKNMTMERRGLGKLEKRMAAAVVLVI